jgi:hypothetical protein
VAASRLGKSQCPEQNVKSCSTSHLLSNIGIKLKFTSADRTSLRERFSAGLNDMNSFQVATGGGVGGELGGGAGGGGGAGCCHSCS